VAGKKAISNADRIEPLFVLPADSSRLLTAAFQVSVHFVLVAKVVSDYGIHFGERDRWVLFGDGFSGRALAEGGYDRVQRYARAADSHDAIRVRR
jgi:V8-like Glu-specific endopeptidase